MNNYAHEFLEEIDSIKFKEWMNHNLDTFCRNMDYEDIKIAQLREWIELFLLWTEYEDNKE